MATILFVEDQKQMAEIFKSVLTAKGYDVIVIHHGSQALELIEENADDIDILVTDIVLPGVSGISLAHKLKLEVVAEGAETMQQVRFLKRCRCDQVQGFVFSRPLSFLPLCRFLSSESSSVLQA